MKRFFSFVIIVLFIAGGVFVGLKVRSIKAPPLVGQAVQAPKSILGQKTQNDSEKVDLPIKLIIPSLQVEAAVEYVGLDSKGNMDVPKNPDNVAWYNLGPKPGEVGSAVIAGHLDTPTGEQAVFWNLSKLKNQDKIVVRDKKGKEITFVVTKVTSYSFDAFPLQEVFGKTDTKRLNLITCNGQFNRVSKNYSERLVVFAQALP